MIETALLFAAASVAQTDVVSQQKTVISIVSAFQASDRNMFRAAIQQDAMELTDHTSSRPKSSISTSAFWDAVKTCSLSSFHVEADRSYVGWICEAESVPGKPCFSLAYSVSVSHANGGAYRMSAERYQRRNLSKCPPSSNDVAPPVVRVKERD